MKISDSVLLHQHYDQEAEATLIVSGESAKKIISELAELKRLGLYYLIHAKVQNIHDYYFDTKSGKLAANGFGLRIRINNKKKNITLKGKPKRTAWGGVQRIEIERDYHKPGIMEILSYLRHEIGDLLIEKEINDWQQPILLMKRLGFKVIQERKNCRLVRQIAAEENTLDPFAELALDSLIFFVNEAEIYSYEIEVELKKSSDMRLLHSLIKEIIKLHPRDVQCWEFSKLSTGRRMLHLWNEGILQSTLDEKKQLTWDSYEMIRKFGK